jgi:hypothetical protein
VAAVLATRERAALTEARVRLAEGSEGTDAELRAHRIRRASEAQAAGLLEALYLASTHALREATGSPDPSPDLVMAESVYQYAMLETANAFGVIPVDDPSPLVQAVLRLAGR